MSTPLENYPSGDVLNDVTEINRLMESAIRQYPSQYLWQCTGYSVKFLYLSKIFFQRLKS